VLYVTLATGIINLHKYMSYIMFALDVNNTKYMSNTIVIQWRKYTLYSDSHTRENIHARINTHIVLTVMYVYMV